MSLFADLKKRRVFKVAGVYLAIAWGATEILLVVIDHLGLPASLSTLTVILFVVGFPVAVFLAWVFDVTPEGIRRTEPGTAKSTLSVVVALLFLVVGTGGLYYLLDSRASRQTGERTALVLPPRSIAVLPFEAADAEDSSELLASGLVDELLARFGIIPDLKVTARASSFSNAIHGLDAREIGQRLGVRQLLQGRVRSAGENLRVNASLVDTISGYQIWGGTIEVAYADSMTLPARLVEEVIEALEFRVGEETRNRATRVRRTDPRAYDLYLLGRQRLRDEIDDNTLLAVRYFEQALEIDPDFAKAHAGLAMALPLASLYMRVAPDEAISRARDAALRAVAIDDSLPDAHFALANIEFQFYWDWTTAGREYRRVTALAPGYAEVLSQYAFFLATTGEHDSAIETMRRVVELDPLTANMELQVGWLLNYGRRFEEALAQFDNVEKMMPENATVHMLRAWPLLDLGRIDEAIAMADRSIELAPDDNLVLGGNAWTLARAGQKERALALLEKWRELSGSNYADPITDAVVHLALGNKDEGFHHIGKMIEQRAASVVFLPQGHEFDPVRDDPRFHSMLEQAGLARWARLEAPP